MFGRTKGKLLEVVDPGRPFAMRVEVANSGVEVEPHDRDSAIVEFYEATWGKRGLFSGYDRRGGQNRAEQQLRRIEGSSLDAGSPLDKSVKRRVNIDIKGLEKPEVIGVNCGVDVTTSELKGGTSPSLCRMEV